MIALIVDTSVLIAAEQARPLAHPVPDGAAISVVTLAELELGVLAARDESVRAQRLATLTRVQQRVTGVPADAAVASAYARLAAKALARGARPRVQDTWIAATALAHRVPVWTQDAEFSRFDDVEVVQV